MSYHPRSDEWVRCNARGPTQAWNVDRTGRPRCNRPVGHAGNHRRYDHGAYVDAEWEPSETQEG